MPCHVKFMSPADWELARHLEPAYYLRASVASSVQLSPNLCRKQTATAIAIAYHPYTDQSSRILSYHIPSNPIQVYRPACGPPRWFLPPLYRGMFNAAIDATTSAGARRCQVASVRFELAPTVTAKTWPFGRSVFKRAWNMSKPVLAIVEETTGIGAHLPSSVWSSPRQRTNSGGSPTCVPYSLMRRVAM